MGGDRSTPQIVDNNLAGAGQGLPVEAEVWERAQQQQQQETSGMTLRERLRQRLLGAPTQPELRDNPERPNGPEQPQPGGDRLTENPVVNGALNLKYGEPQFDQKLAANPAYTYINITDIPQGVKVKHSADQNGYFFWYAKEEVSAAGQKTTVPAETVRVQLPDGSFTTEPKRHYYSIQAKEISMNGDRRDLEATRLLVNEALSRNGNDQFRGFSSFGRSQQVDMRLPGAPQGRTDAFTYFTRMSQLGARALEIQQKTLEENIKTSDNPYFKIYLADVYVAQAMKPIIDQVRNGGNVIELNNPETIKKLEDAISLVQAARGEAHNGLSRIKRATPGNMPMPLDPYSIYMNPADPYFNDYYRRYGNDGTGPWYYFWGGSYDQAAHREVALTFIRDLLKNNALPRIELPPNLPPRLP